MQFRVTPSGGRVAEGSTKFGTYRVEWDSFNRLVSESCTPLEPPKPSGPDPLATLTDAQRSTVATRKAVCNACDQNGGLSAVTVKCHGCGCAGLSLLNGTCKLNKWPTPSAS